MKNPVRSALLVFSTVLIYSFFSNANFPLRLISPAFALLTSALILLALRPVSFPALKTGFNISRPRIVTVIIGLVLGSVAGMRFRMEFYPSLLFKPGWFILMAPLIGIGEEFLFRGFLQLRLRPLKPVTAVFLSTAMHTCYKIAIFILPQAPGIDLVLLAVWSAIAGVILGILTEYAESIVPSAIAHALFDILAYGSLGTAPWWVF